MTSLKSALVMAGLVDALPPTIPVPNRQNLPYKYRGLPCNIQPDEKLWCVSGSDTKDGSVGVLEWCYDKQDATYIYTRMLEDTDRFHHLKIEKFTER